MKINNITTNPTFNGYKNLISLETDENQKSIFSYMAMELNNEGENDLDTWIKIQKDWLKIEKPSNHIVFNTLKIYDETNFSVQSFLLGTENIKNPKDETYMLRTFDLLASLTTRIINTDHHPEDSTIYKTLIELKRILGEIIPSEETVEDLCTNGVKKRVKHYKSAEFCNREITEKMKKYFKL